DSVPFALVKTAIVPDVDVYDMDRIEVLRGPQGTLYGANAQSGVVRVLTKDADVSAFELKTRVSTSATEYGGESYRGDLGVNVPIVQDTLAVRVVGGYQDLSGWIDQPGRNDANSGRVSNLRLKISARPLDRLSIDLSAWRSRTFYDAPYQGTDARQYGFTAP